MVNHEGEVLDADEFKTLYEESKGKKPVAKTTKKVATAKPKTTKAKSDKA